MPSIHPPIAIQVDTSNTVLIFPAPPSFPEAVTKAEASVANHLEVISS